MKLNEKVAALKAKCPLLFNVADKDSHPRSGFHIRDGWFPMVERLCLMIEHQLMNYVPEEIRGEIYLAQVKEKFGSLRVYMNVSTPYIDGAIALAESLSHVTCEECGGLGELRTSGYHKVLCDNHNKSELARKKEEYKKYLEEQEQAKRKLVKEKMEKALK